MEIFLSLILLQLHSLTELLRETPAHHHVLPFPQPNPVATCLMVNLNL